MSSELIVAVKDVYKTYRYGKNYVRALKGVTLEVVRGDIVCLVGPSGSGKTTLLNIIGGIDSPDSGSVIVDRISVSKLRGRELSDYRLKKVGYVFQFYNLIPVLTVAENIELPLTLANVDKKTREERVKILLEAVGLTHLASRTPDSLSGGEQQRVAIARALANNPAIVLMDEPSANIDVENTIKIMKLVEKLNREIGQTFIIATHDTLVVKSCFKIYRIRDGVIIGRYTGDDIAKALSSEA
ncbi:MAG: ABC transporter ATP-binding protein [Sulfolobales archaeon]|nr:ABC transporter ATP-binding protein [Sulfolobales archaeon]MDW8082498.1 ABC transporter ATP-binding protein [Sulfolobales archaeon]